MSRVGRRWEKDSILRCEAASGLVGWGKDRLNLVGAKICLSSYVVSNEDEFFWPFGRLELHGRIVWLFVRGYKAHVARGNAD